MMCQSCLNKQNPAFRPAGPIRGSPRLGPQGLRPSGAPKRGDQGAASFIVVLQTTIKDKKNRIEIESLLIPITPSERRGWPCGPKRLQSLFRALRARSPEPCGSRSGPRGPGGGPVGPPHVIAARPHNVHRLALRVDTGQSAELIRPVIRSRLRRRPNIDSLCESMNRPGGGRRTAAEGRFDRVTLSPDLIGMPCIPIPRLRRADIIILILGRQSRRPQSGHGDPKGPRRTPKGSSPEPNGFRVARPQIDQKIDFGGLAGVTK